MRGYVNSECETAFIRQSFLNDLRIDDRKCSEYRQVEITLGSRRGACFVTLGHTKSFAHVTAELIKPKQGRPYSGVLKINVDMSPMAAPNFEAGRLGEKGIEVTRMLERMLKESNCIDLESLCIIANEKVWQINVDVHIIDNDGSLIDCASIAAICALKSFRRPDVTICGESFTVHSPEEREPVSLNLFHMPICMTFGLTEDGLCTTVDPSEREKSALEGEVIVAMNSHKEVCAIHCTGGSVLKKEQVLRCVSMAAQRSQEMSDMIKATFEADTLERSKKRKQGFSALVKPYKIMFGSFKLQGIVETLPKNESIEKYEMIDNFIEDEAEWNEAKQKKLKKKIAHLGRASPSLMTQKSTNIDADLDRNVRNSVEDEAAIIEEILNVQIAEKTKNECQHDEDDYEMEITAVKKKTRKERKQRLKRKDDDVAQLLIDLENDDVTAGDASFKRSDDDLQIVGEFKKTYTERDKSFYNN